MTFQTSFVFSPLSMWDILVFGKTVISMILIRNMKDNVKNYDNYMHQENVVLEADIIGNVLVVVILWYGMLHFHMNHVVKDLYKALPQR